jgi:hypothetical protein
VNSTSLPIKAMGVATHLYPLDGSRPGGGSAASGRCAAWKKAAT